MVFLPTVVALFSVDDRFAEAFHLLGSMDGRQVRSQLGLVAVPVWCVDLNARQLGPLPTGGDRVIVGVNRLQVRDKRCIPEGVGVLFVEKLPEVDVGSPAIDRVFNDPLHLGHALNVVGSVIENLGIAENTVEVPNAVLPGHEEQFVHHLGLFPADVIQRRPEGVFRVGEDLDGEIVGGESPDIESRPGMTTEGHVAVERSHRGAPGEQRTRWRDRPLSFRVETKGALDGLGIHHRAVGVVVEDAVLVSDRKIGRAVVENETEGVVGIDPYESLPADAAFHHLEPARAARFLSVRRGEYIVVSPDTQFVRREAGLPKVGRIAGPDRFRWATRIGLGEDRFLFLRRAVEEPANVVALSAGRAEGYFDRNVPGWVGVVVGVLESQLENLVGCQLVGVLACRHFDGRGGTGRQSRNREGKRGKKRPYGRIGHGLGLLAIGWMSRSARETCH